MKRLWHVIVWWIRLWWAPEKHLTNHHLQQMVAAAKLFPETTLLKDVIHGCRSHAKMGLAGYLVTDIAEPDLAGIEGELNKRGISLERRSTGVWVHWM